MREFKAAVFIGKFGPIHLDHLEIAHEGLKKAERLIFIIGSCFASRSPKYPFDFAQRKALILASIPEKYHERISIVGVRDYPSDEIWAIDIQTKVREIAGPTESVALLGYFKDDTSKYLKMFPQWELTLIRTHRDLDSTKIREKLLDIGSFTGDGSWKDKESGLRLQLKINLPEMTPSAVTWLNKNFINTPKHHLLIHEAEFLKEYEKKWGLGPFLTTDAVLVCSGHVLVVKRKRAPGQGLWALPGGFLKSKERIIDGAIRELKEETRIQVDKIILKAQVEDVHVFDDPNRSLRGRVITHAFYMRLKEGKLPEVTGDDDAEHAKWMPLMDVVHNEEFFFEDHFQIIQYFLNRN